MQDGSIKDFLLLSALSEEIESSKAGNISSATFPQTIKMLHSTFATISDEECNHLLSLLIATKGPKTDNVDLVVTAPASFKLRTLYTGNVVNDIIAKATKSILITGYSVSDYIDDFLKLIINKSQSGVFVKLFVNNLDKQDALKDIVRYKGRFLEIYDYSNGNDAMSALHAKVVSVDGMTTFISSANLSYHGMEGNIELGCKIDSQRVAQQVDDVFKQLLFQKVFIKQ